MESTINVALSRQMAVKDQMSVIANNIANMSSGGYKAERLVFKRFIARTVGGEAINFVGKEIGRTESIRDELRRAAEEDDQAPRELLSGREVDSKGETGVCLLPAGGWPIAKSNISIRI